MDREKLMCIRSSPVFALKLYASCYRPKPILLDIHRGMESTGNGAKSKRLMQ